MTPNPYMQQTGAARMELVNTFMRGVYGWMSAGLALTAGIAFLLTQNVSLLSMFFNVDPITGQVAGLSASYLVMIVAELGIVFYLSARIAKMAPGTATGLFLLYAGLNGITLTPILLVYTGASVAKTFIICAGMFGAMSIYGLTTKRDLTSMGGFLTMGLIGLLIAMVVNMFMQSAMMEFVISGVGILLFLGLTAYDTQALKTMGEQMPADEAAVRRGTIMGALKLYLDFINLFIMLLRLFGQARD